MPDNKGIHVDIKINFNGLAKAAMCFIGYRIIKEFIDFYIDKED